MFGLFKPKGYTNVSVSEVKTALGKRSKVILDVRTKNEFSAGHIKGAVNIDVMRPDFVSRIAKLDKSKEYYVYCKSGMRSKRACKLMVKAEVTGGINNLNGGYMLWQRN